MHGRAGLRVNPLLKDLNHSIEKERPAWSYTKYREAKEIACMKCCDGLFDKIFTYA
jgi:hypothetical protein